MVEKTSKQRPRKRPLSSLLHVRQRSRRRERLKKSCLKRRTRRLSNGSMNM